MGLLGNLFRKEEELPPLDGNSIAARRLEGFRAALGTFVVKVSDRIELVPAENALFAFVGKPPDAFGVVWWRDGEEHNFKTLMKAKGLSQVRVQLLSDALRDCYKRHASEPRFSTTIAGKRLVVDPSDSFALDVDKIIHEVE